MSMVGLERFVKLVYILGNFPTMIWLVNRFGADFQKAGS